MAVSKKSIRHPPNTAPPRANPPGLQQKNPLEMIPIHIASPPGGLYQVRVKAQ
jgi:hypothetical protein